MTSQPATEKNSNSSSQASVQVLPAPKGLERFIYGLLKVLAYLPLWFWRGLGLMIGWLVYALLDMARKRKQVADTNLRLCFPELNAAQRRRLIRQHCVRLTQSVLDRIWLWHGSEALLRRRVRLAQDSDSTALLDAKPTILFAPHFLGMDAGGLLLAPLVPERACVTIYTPLRNAVLDRWVRRGRRRFSNNLPVWRRSGIKPVIAALRKGGALYLLPDMDFGSEESIFVEFFGQPAATLPSLTRLARLGRTQVITAVTYVEAHGYTVHLSAPWENFPTDDIYADTQRMNTDLEGWIRRRPQEYFWLHKRFKTRPPGSPSVY